MNIPSLITGITYFLVAHILIFFQLNGQFKWSWFREHEWVVALMGLPISLIVIWGSKYTVQGLGGLLWPSRFIGFGVGMIVYAVLVSYFFNEGVNTKTTISLVLAILLIFIQVTGKN